MAGRDVSDEDDDDEFSFSSDLTIEPDDEFKSNPNSRQSARRVHWTPTPIHHINLDSQNSNVSSSGATTDRNEFPVPGSGLLGDLEKNNSVSEAGIEMDSSNNSDSSTAIVGHERRETSGGAVNNDSKDVTLQLRERIFRIIMELLPSLFLTFSIQFIDLLAGAHLFLVSLIVFQAIFWPAVAYVLYVELWKKTTMLEPLSTFSQGKWANLCLLQVQATITVGAVLLQLWSIEYLDITVSLAMSFLPCIILILMEHIMQEKSCSVELIVTLVVGYSGVVCAAIPSLLAEHPQIQAKLYKGIAASIGSSLLCIEASLLLTYLRNRNVEDSLITASIGFQGTLFCVVIGACKNVLGPLRKSNAGIVSGIVLFTLIGVLLLMSQTKRGVRQEISREKRREEGEISGETQTETISVPPQYVSIVKQRVLIFAFSCFWGLFKQFHTHTFPSAFSVFGVTLIVTSFLLSTAYREWNAVVNQRGNDQENDGAHRQSSPNGRKHQKPFTFIPWLFSREPILFIH